MKLCPTCNEPDEGSLQHNVSENEARMYGPRPCGVCRHAARVTCVLGAGDFVLVCPSGHRSGTSTWRRTA
jgi:hypothetical protein